MDPVAEDLLIEIPVEDLQIIKAALNAAFHHATVIDLAEQYRKLQQRPVQSKLTASLRDALTLVGAYIELGEQGEASGDE